MPEKTPTQKLFDLARRMKTRDGWYVIRAVRLLNIPSGVLLPSIS
jgi:hypothetical protein